MNGILTYAEGQDVEHAINEAFKSLAAAKKEFHLCIKELSLLSLKETQEQIVMAIRLLEANKIK
jgi:hypothetical protein